MKNFMLLIVLSIIPFSLFSQDATKKETQDWIKEKIELYPFNNGRTINKYKVSFDATNIIIEEQLILDIGGHLISEVTIPLKNLMQVTFEEKAHNIWMYFKIRNNSNEIKDECKSIGETKYISIHPLLLQKSIDSEGLRPRLVKAFNHLVKLSGGKVVEEKF